MHKLVKYILMAEGHYVSLTIENVSVLAANIFNPNAIITGANNGIFQTHIVPEHARFEDITVRLNDIQHRVFKACYDGLEKTNVKPEDMSQTDFEKLIVDKAQSVVAGFVPAGMLTELKWSGTTKDLNTVLNNTVNHPLAEVRAICSTIEKLSESASSIENICHVVVDLSPDDDNPAKTVSEIASNITPGKASTYEKASDLVDECSFHEDYALELSYSPLSIQELNGELNGADLAEENTLCISDNTGVVPEMYSELIKARPKHTDLPLAIRGLGSMEIMFPIDYLSFLELYKYSSEMVMPNSLLLPYCGMHAWYTDSILDKAVANEVLTEVENILNEIKDAIKREEITELEAQYLIPLGCKTFTFINPTIDTLVKFLQEFSHCDTQGPLREMMSIIAKRFYQTHSAFKMFIDHSDPIVMVQSDKRVLDVTETHATDGTGPDADEIREREELPPDAVIDFMIAADGESVSEAKFSGKDAVAGEDVEIDLFADK